MPSTVAASLVGRRKLSTTGTRTTSEFSHFFSVFPLPCPRFCRGSDPGSPELASDRCWLSGPVPKVVSSRANCTISESEHASDFPARTYDKRLAVCHVNSPQLSAGSLHDVFSSGNIFARPQRFLRWRKSIIGSIAGRKIETRTNINIFRASASSEQGYR